MDCRRRVATAASALALALVVGAAPGAVGAAPVAGSASGGVSLTALQARATANARALVAAAREIRAADAAIARLEARLRRVRASEAGARARLRERAVAAYIGRSAPAFGLAVDGDGPVSALRRGTLLDAAEAPDRADLRRRQAVLDQDTAVVAAATRSEQLGDAQRAWLAAVASAAGGSDATVPAPPSASEPAIGPGAGPPPAVERQQAVGAPDAALTVPIADLACPVDGPRSFTNDWGNGRSGFRFHLGTDMFAARGTPVVAVAPGVARRTLSSKGGISVWLESDAGVAYYYAHLASWAGDWAGGGAGDGPTGGRRVDRGEAVGFVGDSGNAAGGPTHLHFQVHPAGGGAVNPFSIVLFACTR
jgi:murein DD-endopeptidase MepM/ murein hydrolase activator NlpD